MKEMDLVRFYGKGGEDERYAVEKRNRGEGK